MKTILIVLLLLVLFGGGVTYLSIRKKLKQNIKQARSKVEGVQVKENEKLKRLREENE